MFGLNGSVRVGLVAPVMVAMGAIGLGWLAPAVHAESPTAKPLATVVSAEVWVADASNVRLDSGSQVQSGDRLVVHVAGFPATSRVSVSLAGNTVTGISADAAGSGSANVTVPAVASDAYVLTATSGSTTVEEVIYIFNPSGITPAKPTVPAADGAAALPPPAAAGGKPASGGKSTSSGGKSAASAGNTSSVATTSTPSTLAHTGASTQAGVLAALLLLVGGVLLLLSRPAARLGRHALSSAGTGRQCRAISD